MEKISSAQHTVPFQDLSIGSIVYLYKEKKEINAINCIGSQFVGYAYQFQQSATPIIENITYRLKGYIQSAHLTFLNHNSGNQGAILGEIEMVLAEVKTHCGGGAFDPLESISGHILTSYNNQTYNDKIFQQSQRVEFRNEVYADVGYGSGCGLSVSINSNIYIHKANSFVLCNQ